MKHCRLGILVVVVLVALAPATGAAQGTNQPLALTFVDATPNSSRAIQEKLRAIISKSNDIRFTKPSNFLYKAQQFNISIDTLKTTQARTSHRELMRRAMRANNLEAIIVYKRTGQKLHLIVIGPTGAELRHFRSPVRREQLSDQQAIAVLKRLFKVLVPEVKTFRQQQSQLDQTRPTVDESQQTGMSEDEQIKDEVVKKHKESHGNLGKHFTIMASPVFGRRQLSIQTEGGFKLGHATPFFGAGLRLDSIFAMMSSDTAAFGGTIYGSYAPFKTQFSNTKKKFQGSFIRLGLQLRYLAGLSSKFIVFGQLGGEAFNIGIDSNSTYVGSTYFALAPGAGLIYRLGEVGDIRLGLNALPTLMTNTNDKAFGKGGFSLGFRGEGRFTLRALEPLLFSAFYDFELFSPNHPSPSAYDTPASGSDTVHMGGVAVGYEF